MSTEAQQLADLQKRQREKKIAYFIAISFVLVSFLQAWVAERRQTYGFINSLMFFGLLHLNVILIMLLVFLIVRNLVKAYVLRRSRALGASLRFRMVSSLLFFSLVPSILLFVGASSIIRQGFDRWFGSQVGRALEDAQAISKVHYEGLQNNLVFFSSQIRDDFKNISQIPNQAEIQKLRLKYPVQAVEFYLDKVSGPLRSLQDRLPDWAVPRASAQTLDRAFSGESFHLLRSYGDGDLIQYFLPQNISTPSGSRFGVLVLSENVPLGLKTRIQELQSAFADYQRTALFKDSLKTNYTLVLLTLFVLVIFALSWFGLYLAKSVTDPVSDLLKGTEAFRLGQWNYRIPTWDIKLSDKALKGAGADLEVLKNAFNLMADEVGRRRYQIEEANAQLTTLVHDLEERESYLENLLSSIRRGVLVIDSKGNIQRVNAEALSFSPFEKWNQSLPAQAVGKNWRDVFYDLGAEEDLGQWLDEVRVRNGNPVDLIFEVERKSIESQKSLSVLSVRATGMWILDDRRVGLGWLIILEDVTNAARLERLAAWQEVARRVAHEIKNPLTPIQISVDRLNRRMGMKMEENETDGPVFKECVSQIQKQVRVIRDLVREFSDFAKLPEPKMVLMDLVKLYRDILKDYEFTHPQMEFILSVDSSIEKMIKADPEYIRRLVVNLTDNAIHSLEDARVENPAFALKVFASESDPHFIVTEFSDNGPGIPEHLRDKIFDPYVSSKASGLGLGLPIVRRIAIEHSGRIRCDEGPGGRFTLELPWVRGDDKHGSKVFT